jgi:hypothetical protein
VLAARGMRWTISGRSPPVPLVRDDMNSGRSGPSLKHRPPAERHAFAAVSPRLACLTTSREDKIKTPALSHKSHSSHPANVPRYPPFVGCIFSPSQASEPRHGDPTARLPSAMGLLVLKSERIGDLKGPTICVAFRARPEVSTSCAISYCTRKLGERQWIISVIPS